MKRLIILTGTFLVIVTNLFAQYTFDWMQGAGNYAKTSVMSTVDSEDNLIVTGYWQSYQIFTRKYDISGTLLWEVADASGISGLYEKSNWINCDANNNVLVVGNIYSHSTSWDYPTDIIALKYSPSGTLLWKTIIPISILINNVSSFNCRSVIDDIGNLYIGTAITGGATLYKLDTNGNLIFTNSSTINAPWNFSSMRIKGNKIALATASPIPNVAPVFVYDTSGALLWTAAAEGFSASDVEIDENLNVYVLSSLENAVSGSSGVDMRITKFTSTGTQLWSHDYDFGGTEISRRFVYLNDRISAIGYGSSSPSSPYFDWKTFQTDTEGTLLWHAIYDATTYNDEEPYYILAKPTGEVIVTGKGGPSPDPNNPSFIQMPIVEYSNTGTQIWIDTPNIYGGWGLASMFASDASLYAISSSDMTVYHYNYLPSPNDATLSDLTVNGTTVNGFSPSLINYTVGIPTGDPVPVTGATTNNPAANLNITQATAVPGQSSVLVTAEDGVTQLTYTILFYVMGTDATLLDLTIDGTTIPGFAPDVFNYDYQVATGDPIPVVGTTLSDPLASMILNQATSLPGAATVVVTSEDGLTTNTYTVNFLYTPNNIASLSDLLINGVTIAGFAPDVYDYSYAAVYPSPAPFALGIPTDPLATVDDTQCASIPCDAILLVTAEDGVTTLTYTVHYYYLGYDATLSDLTIDGTTIPDFDPSVINYQYLVDDTTSIPVVGGTTNDPLATLSTTQATNIPGEATLLVLAQDNVTEITYTVYFYTSESDATLADLTLEGFTVEGFDPLISYYEVGVYEGMPVPLIDGTPNDPLATIDITQASGIPGEGTILVTAQDLITQLTYTVEFYLITGIIENEDIPISIFPNPASNTLNITGIRGLVQLEIINLYGTKIITSTMDNDKKLDIGFISPGIYFIVFKTENKVIATLKFVKK